jgi:hypothetical protein
MQRNPIICFFLFISFFIEAQYTDQINSNRPGLSIGAFAVGKDVVQAEVGIAYRHIQVITTQLLMEGLVFFHYDGVF